MKTTAAKPLPSVEELHRLFTLDHETGHLFWKPRPRADFTSERQWLFWNKHFPGKQADYLHYKGYRRVWIRAEGKPSEYYAHRLVWKMVNGLDPVPEVDHIDRDPSNNCPANLRQATRCVNVNNRSNSRGTGVYKQKSGLFLARFLKAEGRLVRFGPFATEAAAYRAIELAGETP